MDSKLSDSQIVSQISGKQRMIKFLNFIHPLLFIAMPAAIFWGFANWDRNIGKGIFFIILGLLCIPFLVVLGKSVNALERKIKSLTGEYLVKGVLAEKVQVEKYAPNEYINPDFVKNCNILPNYDRISGSDYVSGTYRGVPFTILPICICSIRIPTGIKTDGKERVTTQRKWFSLRYRQRCGRISRHEPEQS